MMFGKIYVFVDWCWERKQLELWSREASRARVGIDRIREACGLDPKIDEFSEKVQKAFMALMSKGPSLPSTLNIFLENLSILSSSGFLKLESSGLLLSLKLEKGPYRKSIRAVELFLVDRCVRKDLLVGTFARILSLIYWILKQQTRDMRCIFSWEWP